MENKIRVMIVEDSPVIREVLVHIIRRDARLQVVSAVGSAEQALAALHRVAPDVISLDICLPGMNGFEATQRIMAERPTPIVIVSAQVEATELKSSMNALRAGALSVVEKPVGLSHADYETVAERICTQLAIMSRVKVIRQRFGGKRRAAFNSRSRAAWQPAMRAQGTSQTFEALAMVASTGGPKALQTILAELPATFPLPVLLVQHITASFQAGFVQWLDEITPLSVREARSGEIPLPGHVYVAPADRHLRLNGRRLELTDEPPACAQRPSGTVLFESMARSLGPAGLGVLLTGMGQDGAAGLSAMRQSGAYTIVEDESTAVVYGMPAAAVALRAECESLPLPDMAARLLELAGGPVANGAERVALAP